MTRLRSCITRLTGSCDSIIWSTTVILSIGWQLPIGCQLLPIIWLICISAPCWQMTLIHSTKNRHLPNRSKALRYSNIGLLPICHIQRRMSQPKVIFILPNHILIYVGTWIYITSIVNFLPRYSQVLDIYLHRYEGFPCFGLSQFFTRLSKMLLFSSLTLSVFTIMPNCYCCAKFKNFKLSAY